MLRRSILLVTVLMTLSLQGPTTAAPSHTVSVQTALNATSDSACLDSEEQKFLQLINDYRAQNSVAPLVAVQTLGAAADYHSFDMAAHNYLSHILYDGTTWSQNMTNFGYPTGGWRGENLAGSREFAIDNYWAWYYSGPHNATMLDVNAKVIGIGRAYNVAADGGWRWTTDFGSYSTGAAVLCSGSPAPTATNTPIPPATSTTAPNPTNTPNSMPTASNTPTPPPTATNTPVPQPTATQPPAPTSTPAPVAAVYVAGMSGKATAKGKSTTISVSVAISDTDARAVNGASVTMLVTAPDGTSQTLTATTNGRGQANASVKATHGSGVYLARVTNVTASSRPYDPSKNAASSVSIAAP
jgi:uncharacterized protein YkwD